MKLVILILFCLSLVLHSAAQQTPKLVLPTGHLGGVTKLDSSPNKKLLLTEDQNSDIIIIDSDKLIELQRHNFEGFKITSSTFLNDSSVISICNDTLVSVWNFYSDKVDLYPTVPLNKVYVENHGLYCIDKHGVLFTFEILEKDIVLRKFIKDKATEVYFKSEKEIFLVNGNNLIFVDLNRTKKLKRKFENEITSLSWNTIGNVLLGFDNGEIHECDSNLTRVHKYISSTDRISSILYLNDSLIVSGSYDFSVRTQGKNGFLDIYYLDDWVVRLINIESKLIGCSWNGEIIELLHDLSFLQEFETNLKEATFFSQKANSLFISYNDGNIVEIDVKNRIQKNEYKICQDLIYGFDVNQDSDRLVVYNDSGIIVFNVDERNISVQINRDNIVAVKYIPNTSRVIFCSDEYLYYQTKEFNLDSILLIETWSLVETNDHSIIASGDGRIIEICSDTIIIHDLKNLGQIWTCKKIREETFLIASSTGQLDYFSSDGKSSIIAKFPMNIDEIELISDFKAIINCENGQLIEVNLENGKYQIIADSKQEYGSWDFKFNKNTGRLIYPNSKIWDYHMEVNVLDLKGEIQNNLENIGGEIICISDSRSSIEFNELDSNQVIFIVSDGSVRLWDINTDGNDPITQLGFDYFNLLKDELDDFNIKGAFLKSGLLKLPIPGVDTLTFMNLKNGDWLVHDSKYRFDGTPGAIEKLYFTCGLEILELNQVKDSLYVPNLIQRYTNGEKLEHIPEIKDLNICGYTPLIEAIDSLNYKITPRNGGVGEIAVFINGIQRLTYTSKMLQFENGIYRLILSEADINPFREIGKPMQIKVVAKTADNSVSSRGVVVEFADNQMQTRLKPSIHAIMIGVDSYKDEALQLEYAAKDANDLQVALQLAAINYFNVDDTNRVFFYNLTVNAQGKMGTNNIRGITPDRGNIIKTLQEIERSSKPEDVILLFFAGHGEIVENGQLLLLSSESTRDDFQGIKMNELLALMNKIPAGKRILILDACHSGAAINNMDLVSYSGRRDVSDVEKETYRLKELDKLATKSGFAIITASGSNQKALELPQYEHGLLTYCLLNSIIQNRSVLDDDNQLVLEKWFIAAEEEMKKLNIDQNAEKMIISSFNIGIVNEEVIRTITIKESPVLEIAEVINSKQFLTDSYPLDDYFIREKLKSSFISLKQITNKQILLIEGGGNGVKKLVVKYNILNDQIEMKCNLVFDGNIVFTINKIAALNGLDKAINELVFEIYNLLKNDF